MEENVNIFALVLDELNKNDMWFTTKADPTAEEARSYYKLDEYGGPTEATVKKIEKEVSSLIGDGAVDEYDAVKLWVNDALVDFRIDYKDNLVTQFEDKPVVDNIEAYENPVQFPQSKKTEAKTKKTEGAGAGYHINGIINVNNINTLNVVSQDEPDKYGDVTATIDCDIDVTLTEMSASSYYYGNDINVDVPAKVTGLTVVISEDDKQNDIGVDESSIKELLDGTKFKTLIGGGWTHTTFTGDMQLQDSEITDSEYYYSYFTAIDIQILDENMTKYIDSVVLGENFYTEFLVYDRDGDIISDEFTAEEADYSAVDKAQDDAIEFAKANKGVRVVKQTYRELADGDLDNYDIEPEVVWERDYDKNYKFDDEVEESKKVKTESKEDLDKSSKEIYKQVIVTFECDDCGHKEDWTFDDMAEWRLAYLEASDSNNEVGDCPECGSMYYNMKNYKIIEESKKVKTEAYEKTLDDIVANAFKKVKGKVPDTIKYNGKTYKQILVMGDTAGNKNKVMFYVGDDPNTSEDYFYVIYTLNKADDFDVNPTHYKGVKNILSVEDYTVLDECKEKTSYYMSKINESKKRQIEAFKNRNVNFNKRTKDKIIEAITDNFYSAFDSHGFRRKINKDTTIEELINELHNFIEFENISKDDTRKAIKDIVSHLNMQLNANLDALSIYLWYINGNYGGTYEKVRKNKITENYQRRLDEVNNKSKNLISDLFSSNDFDSDSPAGQIVMRTSEMFNALSDKGYDVEVTFDNGESTSAIQLGQQGGKVMITITNTDQPLRAFTSGNFEINDQNIKILQDIQSQIEVL